MENAAFPVGICAEVCAVGRAVVSFCGCFFFVFLYDFFWLGFGSFVEGGGRGGGGMEADGFDRRRDMVILRRWLWLRMRRGRV